MFKETLEYLKCPKCQADLEHANVLEAKTQNHASRDLQTGAVECDRCKVSYPILSGILILVEDVRRYLIEHVKGISRFVRDEDVPKNIRASYVKAKKEIVTEHIEEDLEAERVTSLYVMNHYLKGTEVHSPDPILNDMIKKHWDQGPFSVIQAILEKNTKNKPKLIELGCGVGGLCRAVSNQVSAYLGLDSSFASIALARHLALGAPSVGQVKVPDDLLWGSVSRSVSIAPPDHINKSQADFIVCDLANPPIKENIWDTTVALNVIDMLPEPAALPELQYKLLKQQGIAIQSCPYIWHQDVSEQLRQMLPKNIKSSAEAVEWLYTDNGFKVTESQPHVPWIFFKNVRQIELYSTHVFSAMKS